MREHRLMNREEKKTFDELIKSIKDRVDDRQILTISKLYSDIFSTRFVIPCRCESRTLKSWIRMLTKVREESKKVR